MSYSVCLECREMVIGYEKYCHKCVKSKKGNDYEFWKNHGYEYLQDPLRLEEINKDLKETKIQGDK